MNSTQNGTDPFQAISEYAIKKKQKKGTVIYECE